MKKPFVLFLYIQRAKYNKFTEPVEIMGSMCLSAQISKHGYEGYCRSGDIHDAISEFEKANATGALCAVGLYSDFENVNALISFSKYIKSLYSIPILVGGPQAIGLGKEFLEQSGCDCLIRGDGENSLLKLLNIIVKEQGEPEDIPGVCLLNGQGEFIENKAPEYITDLEEYPVPDLTQTAINPLKRTSIPIISGRGCPFKCSFCAESNKDIRIRSVSHVIDEIETKLQMNLLPKLVWFSDDTFTINKNRVHEFCIRLKEIRRKYDFVWFCEAHPSFILKYPEMMKEMVEAGLVRIQIGIETGVEQIAKEYNKKTNPAEIKKTVRICKEAGLLQMHGNFIFGGAYETPGTMEETICYAEDLIELGSGMMEVTSTFLTPFPDTAITRNPHKFGINIIDIKCETAFGDFPVIETPSAGRYLIAQKRYEFLMRTMKCIQKLIQSGAVTHEQLTRHFELMFKYKVTSLLYTPAFLSDRFLYRRYNLLACGRFGALDDIAEDKWRASRVISVFKPHEYFQPAKEITQSSSGSGSGIFTEKDLQLLMLSDGRHTIEEIARVMGYLSEGFDGNWRKTEIYMELRQLEKRNFIVVAEDWV